MAEADDVDDDEVVLRFLGEGEVAFLGLAERFDRLTGALALVVVVFFLVVVVFFLGAIVFFLVAVVFFLGAVVFFLVTVAFFLVTVGFFLDTVLFFFVVVAFFFEAVAFLGVEIFALVLVSDVFVFGPVAFFTRYTRRRSSRSRR